MQARVPRWMEAAEAHRVGCTWVCLDCSYSSQPYLSRTLGDVAVHVQSGQNLLNKLVQQLLCHAQGELGEGPN